MVILDLTLTISKSLPMFPGSPKPQFISWSTINKDGYNLELLFLSSHSGTHMDVPFHFIKNGKKIHEIPPNRFSNDAILIKLRKKENQAISKSDIIKFEKKYGKISKNATIVFFTGWQKKLQSKYYFKKKSWSGSICSKISCFKKN